MDLLRKGGNSFNYALLLLMCLTKKATEPTLIKTPCIKSDVIIHDILKVDDDIGDDIDKNDDTDNETTW